MATFESSQFKKTVPSPQLREFNVGEPETPQYTNPPVNLAQQQPTSFVDAEKAMREARAAKQAEMTGQQKITPGAKKRIELLTNIGRLTKDVQIGGHTFSLRTLKSKETREAAEASFSTASTNLEASYEVRRHQLARAIFQIDGHGTEDVLESLSLEDKLAWLDDSEELVINKLYEEFNALKNEAQTKYGITSVEVAKEVADDLKK